MGGVPRFTACPMDKPRRCEYEPDVLCDSETSCEECLRRERRWATCWVGQQPGGGGSEPLRGRNERRLGGARRPRTLGR
jgi:hypothetical protein